jgi:hypothetical protein
MTLRYIQDPGHGWLEVPVSELRRVNVHKDITQYSYRKGKTAYLEEDCDMPAYLLALKARGEPRPVLEDVYEEDTPIREYPSYR